jgi:hypothetical protein
VCVRGLNFRAPAFLDANAVFVGVVASLEMVIHEVITIAAVFVAIAIAQVLSLS